MAKKDQPLAPDAPLTERIASAGIELSQSDREILADLETRKAEKARGVINLSRPMSFGDFITAMDPTPNPFSLSGPVKVNTKPQEQGA